MMLNYITRQEAKQRSISKYFTGQPCKRGHIAERFSSSALCVDCASIHNRKAYKRRGANHITLVRSRTIKQEQLNPGFQATRMMKWRKTNRSKWLADRTFQENKRRNKIPRWANKNKIKELYLQCAVLNETSEIKYEVHHIIPLVECSDVCGLHCEDNLIIVTKDKHLWYHSTRERLESLWS
jgi:hypothetical protein